MCPCSFFLTDSFDAPACFWSCRGSRALQILDIEKQIDDTYVYFSGEPIQNLPYSTEEGKMQYEELLRMQQERLDREKKSNALDTEVVLDDGEEELDGSGNEDDDVDSDSSSSSSSDEDD